MALEDINLELERIRLERIKVYSKIVGLLITVGLGTFGVAIVNQSIQQRQLDQQKEQNDAQLKLQIEKARADRQKEEMAYLGEYLNFALEKDVNRRIRFAEYFAALTVSEELQPRWKEYLGTLKSTVEEQQFLSTKLEAARAEGDEPKLALIGTELAHLRSKVEDLGPRDKIQYMPPRPQFFPPNNKRREELFGKFEWEAAPTSRNPSLIKTLDDWESQNIQTVTLPQLKGVPVYGHPSSGRMRFHKKAIEQLKALWAAWEEAGVLHHVLTYEGSYNPRLIRGSRTILSNHAWGSAFDINLAWNPLGTIAGRNEEGSVVELVPIANDYGFWWGGHYEARPDAGQFEVAILLDAEELSTLAEKYNIVESGE